MTRDAVIKTWTRRITHSCIWSLFRNKINPNKECDLDGRYRTIILVPYLQVKSLRFIWRSENSKSRWRHQMETFSAFLTGHLCGEFTGPVQFPHKGQWRGALMFSLICIWINGWVNNREAGDWRRYRAHYDVTVMWNLRVSDLHMNCRDLITWEGTGLVTPASENRVCNSSDNGLSPIRHQAII